MILTFRLDLDSFKVRHLAKSPDYLVQKIISGHTLCTHICLTAVRECTVKNCKELQELFSKEDPVKHCVSFNKSRGFEV